MLQVMKNPEIGSNNYYPGSFDLHGSIDSALKENAALGPPLNILLHKGIELNKKSKLQQQR